MCYICAISYHSCKFHTRKNNRIFKKASRKKEEVGISAEDSVIIVELYLCLADWRVDVCVCDMKMMVKNNAQTLFT